MVDVSSGIRTSKECAAILLLLSPTNFALGSELSQGLNTTIKTYEIPYDAYRPLFHLKFSIIVFKRVVIAFENPKKYRVEKFL